MQQNHRHRRKRLSGTAIAVVLVCAALLYAGVLLGIRTVGNRLEKSDAPEPVGSLDGRFASDKLTLRYANRTWVYRKRDLTNILLMGVDWAEMHSPASSGRYAGQADFLLLVTFDKKNKTVSMLQIDRDTMTDVRVYGPLGTIPASARRRSASPMPTVQRQRRTAKTPSGRSVDCWGTSPSTAIWRWT